MTNSYPLDPPCEVTWQVTVEEIDQRSFEANWLMTPDSDTCPVYGSPIGTYLEVDRETGYDVGRWGYCYGFSCDAGRFRICEDAEANLRDGELAIVFRKGEAKLVLRTEVSDRDVVAWLEVKP